MEAPGNFPGLQLDEDLPHQRRRWKMERRGWIAVAVLVLAGMLGLFGPGLLTERESSSGEEFRLTWHSVVRRDTSVPITVRVQPGSAEEVTIGVSQGYLQSVQIEGITPEPTGSAVRSDEVLFRFAVLGSDPVAIRIHSRAVDVGILRGRVRLEGSDAVVNFTQWVQP